MNGNNVISGEVSQDIIEHKVSKLLQIDRVISISILAAFLRDYPQTHLTDEERRVFTSFQKYIFHLESQLFEEAEIDR